MSRPDVLYCKCCGHITAVLKKRKRKIFVDDSLTLKDPVRLKNVFLDNVAKMLPMELFAAYNSLPENKHNPRPGFTYRKWWNRSNPSGGDKYIQFERVAKFTEVDDG